MSSASKPTISVGIEHAESGTISELISLLRSAFQPMDFDEIQQILITREEAMKRALNEMSIEIENRKRGYDLMERKHGEVELKKLEIDFELKKCKRERDELREQMARYKEEQRVHHDRSRRTEARYDKLLEDFKKVENEKREVILHLKVTSTDLECSKAAARRAEGEVEAWKKKFGELELRVLRLEEDTAMLVNGDYSFPEKIDWDCRDLDEHLGLVVERPVSDEMKENKEPSENGKSQNENGSPNLGHSQPKKTLSDCHEKVHNMDYSFPKKIDGDSRDLDEHLGVESSVSDEMKENKEPSENGKSQNENGSPYLGHSQPKKTLSDCHEKVHNMAGVVSARDSPVTESKGSQAGGPHSFMGSSMKCNLRPESGVIIEIIDSDDEMLSLNGTICISNVCASRVIKSEKETSSKKLVQGALSGQMSEENGRSCMENCFSASMSKRKLDPYTDLKESEKNCDDDYKEPMRKHKTNKLQRLMHEDMSSYVNDCPAMLDSGNTGTTKAVSPSRRNPMFIRQCEDQRAEKNSRSPLRKFTLDTTDSSDSSASSGDETYTNSYIENKILEILQMRDNKTWAFEMDMISAFERDPELCMNAVCALYRQQTSLFKSTKGSLFSKNRGFKQFDFLRGTILAKFLIDCDPQGKLKKSLLELQQSDPKGLDDYRKIANRHSRELFEIYQRKEDPFFLPS